MYVYIHIYIYIHMLNASLSLSLYIYIYVCIHDIMLIIRTSDVLQDRQARARRPHGDDHADGGDPGHPPGLHDPHGRGPPAGVRRAQDSEAGKGTLTLRTIP